MTPACPRLFEAEAWRDGRLSGVEAERFQTHVKACPRCAREVQRLQALGDALRAPVAPADELHVRRERTRLLAAFDARLVPTPRRPVLDPWLVTAAAVLTCAALAFVFRGQNPEPAASVTPRQAAAAEPVLVRADSSARWSRLADEHFETVRLESGALSIRVDHASSPRRLRVLLPDGELEDIGTTFSVSADAGRTTRVSVQEGSVVLRLRGMPALALGAGDFWTPATAPAPAPNRSAESVAPSAAANAKHASAASTARAGGAASAGGGAAAPSAPETAAEPSADFRDAMAALDRGDNSQAAALFAGFVAHHPSDSRAEDAAYLRVLALQRTGNDRATRQAARDYLSRYPHGFRQAEIEPLAAVR